MQRFITYKLKNGATIGYRDFKELKIKDGIVHIYCESIDCDGYYKPFSELEKIQDIEKITIDFAEECCDYCGKACSKCNCFET